jgi:hypothetical protein
MSLSSYWEFTTKLPETADHATQKDCTMLKVVPTEAKLWLVRKQWPIHHSL